MSPGMAMVAYIMGDLAALFRRVNAMKLSKILTAAVIAGRGRSAIRQC